MPARITIRNTGRADLRSVEVRTPRPPGARPAGRRLLGLRHLPAAGARTRRRRDCASDGRPRRRATRPAPQAQPLKLVDTVPGASCRPRDRVARRVRLIQPFIRLRSRGRAPDVRLVGSGSARRLGSGADRLAHRRRVIRRARRAAGVAHRGAPGSAESGGAVMPGGREGWKAGYADAQPRSSTSVRPSPIAASRSAGSRPIRVSKSIRSTFWIS